MTEIGETKFRKVSYSKKDAPPPETKTIFTVMDLLDVSYRNIPNVWDQSSMDITNTISIEEEEKLKYPTVAKYNRRENFQMYDIDTLFFSFYKEHGTY